MSNTAKRAGRKDAVVRIRELVALLGSLSHTGDTVSLDAISTRLGIAHEDAKSLMDIVCTASGEESSGLLISANDTMDVFILQYPNVHGQPIRLTSAETVALQNALNRVGITEDDPLRQRLNESFASNEVKMDMVRQALGTQANEGDGSASESLHACAQALVGGNELMFAYRGLRDQQARPRRVCVRSIYTSDERWYVDALDLDIQEKRTFRVDRMESVRLGPHADAPGITEHHEHKTRVIRFTLLDESYLSSIDWHDLRVVQHTSDGIICEIPYYGSWSTWLIRRIAACGNKIRIEDEGIKHAVQEYVRQQLDER